MDTAYLVLLAQSVFLSMAIIMSNIGARYIVMDLDKRNGTLFAQPYMRYVYVFCMSFLGSRNPYIAGVIVGLYHLLLLAMPITDSVTSKPYIT